MHGQLVGGQLLLGVVRIAEVFVRWIRIQLRGHHKLGLINERPKRIHLRLHTLAEEERLLLEIMWNGREQVLKLVVSDLIAAYK